MKNLEFWIIRLYFPFFLNFLLGWPITPHNDSKTLHRCYSFWRNRVWFWKPEVPLWIRARFVLDSITPFTVSSLAWRGNMSARTPRGRRYKTEAAGSHKSLCKEDLACEQREESGAQPGKREREDTWLRTLTWDGFTGFNACFVSSCTRHLSCLVFMMNIKRSLKLFFWLFVCFCILYVENNVSQQMEAI